jgi:hypothetical protein
VSHRRTSPYGGRDALGASDGEGTQPRRRSRAAARRGRSMRALMKSACEFGDRGWARRRLGEGAFHEGRADAVPRAPPCRAFERERARDPDHAPLRREERHEAQDRPRRTDREARLMIEMPLPCTSNPRPRGLASRSRCPSGSDRDEVKRTSGSPRPGSERPARLYHEDVPRVPAARPARASAPFGDSTRRSADPPCS